MYIIYITIETSNKSSYILIKDFRARMFLLVLTITNKIINYNETKSNIFIVSETNFCESIRFRVQMQSMEGEIYTER